MILYYNYFINYLDSFTSKKFWKWKLILILVLCIHLFSIPGYRYLDVNVRGWVEVNKKIENLFAQTASDSPTSGHAANMVFRLTVPAIAKVFHLSSTGILVVNVFIGIAILYLVISLTIKITGDQVVAFLMAIAVAATYIGKCAFGDFYPLFDQWAYFFLLLSMCFSSPVLVFFSAFLASWTDERGLLALFFVYFFWKYFTSPIQSLKFSSFFKFDKYSVAIIASVVSYTILRLFLKYYYSLNHHVFDIPQQTMFNIPCQRLATWSYFEGLWILIVCAMFVCLKKYSWNPFSIVLILGAFGYLGFSFTIGDLTRTGAYMFPLIFIAMQMLMSVGDASEMRVLMLFSALICVLFPPLAVSCDAIASWTLGEWVVGDFLKAFYYDFWLEYIR